MTKRLKRSNRKAIVGSPEIFVYMHWWYSQWKELICFVMSAFLRACMALVLSIYDTPGKRDMLASIRSAIASISVEAVMS